MPSIIVRIEWDVPDEPYWLNAWNVRQALSAYCRNTKFEVTPADDLLPALVGLYEHTRNNYQICGLNTAALEAIEKLLGASDYTAVIQD